MGITAGQLADRIRGRKLLSTKNVRKMFQTISLAGAGTFVSVMSSMGCEQRYAAVALLCLGYLLYGANTAGYLSNHLDLAPRYAGLLFGITNTMATIPGIVAPIVASALTPEGTAEEWRNVFYLCTAVALLGVAIFVALADGTLQDWAVPAGIEAKVKVEGCTIKDKQGDEALICIENNRTGNLLWVVAWFWLAADSPDQHKYISERERVYITSSIGKGTGKKVQHTPWLSILTSAPLWAAAMAHACSNYTNYTLLTSLPTFMKESLNFDIKANGLLSSLPYLCQFLMGITAGQLADRIRGRKLLSTKNVRKMFQTICTVLVLLALAARTAPAQAGHGTAEEWRNVFYLCTAVALLGVAIFVVLADGTLQDWAVPPRIERKVKVEGSKVKDRQGDEALICTENNRV
ncbi:hypothetical protein EGW08_023606 [Elysia chlorotica]|uniref:Major facilitator superfamily (MFS) profile domain-containing protein n=1 Tax=Elysia chlorotica TaxID=188477 RepID=A0A3S0ZJ32_ELYCH|nr:hypothetical protein EGW08_023606 [Elysia chlorotica]